jgi:hypothetical protein
MDEKQSFERIDEGLKMASAACRQMAHHRKDEKWLKISYMLDDVAKRSRMLLVARKVQENKSRLIL